MKKVKETFLDYLKKNGLKLTGQRRLILDIFVKAKRHLTARELYAMVKEKDSRIGYTTIEFTPHLTTGIYFAKLSSIQHEGVPHTQTFKFLILK